MLRMGSAGGWPARNRAAVLVVGTLIIGACRESTSSGDGGGARIDIQPSRASVAVGSTTSLSARMLDGDGKPVAMPGVFWSSQNEAVATVDALGVVTGVAPGDVQIAASAAGQSGVAQVAVTRVPAASVRVTPADGTVIVGRTLQLTAHALDADGVVLAGRPATWTASPASIATVSAAGVVTGVGAGMASIRARVDNAEGVAVVTVSASSPSIQTITLTTPTDSIMLPGTLAATVTVQGASSVPLPGQDVTLTSDAPAVATIAPGTGSTNQSGRVAATITGVAAGTARITARSGPASQSLTVRVIAPPAVSIVPSSATVLEGDRVTLTLSVLDGGGRPAAGRACVMTSSHASRATVSPAAALTNGSGQIALTVTGVRRGSVTITGTCGPGTARAEVRVED
jgi:uncharacterized protein YjdB